MSRMLIVGVLQNSFQEYLCHLTTEVRLVQHLQETLQRMCTSCIFRHNLELGLILFLLVLSWQLEGLEKQVFMVVVEFWEKLLAEVVAILVN